MSALISRIARPRPGKLAMAIRAPIGRPNRAARQVAERLTLRERRTISARLASSAAMSRNASAMAEARSFMALTPTACAILRWLGRGVKGGNQAGPCMLMQARARSMRWGEGRKAPAAVSCPKPTHPKRTGLEQARPCDRRQPYAEAAGRVTGRLPRLTDHQRAAERGQTLRV